MGKLAQRLAIILLLLLATAMAIEPAGVSGYSAWVGVTNATFADSPSGPAGSTGSFIKIRAYYITDTIISSGRSGGSGDMGSGDIRTQQTAPLANATWQIFFDGKPLLNKSGTVICDAINTTDVGKLSGGQWLEPGEAICAQAGPFYAADPDPAKNGAPKALTNWTGCGMLQVRLVSAPDMSKVRNLNSPAMLYCPTHPQSLGLYNILGLGNLSPAFIATCLPIFIVLGLLIASMYQRGKDPLSLFDITTPRLPAMRKVRMKPVTQPFHLAAKGRMADRIINRSERALGSTLFALYGGKKKGPAAEAARKAALGILPTSGRIFSRDAAAAAKNNEAYQKMLKELRALIDKSTASEAEKNRAWAAAMRLLQVRETMLIDKAAQRYARFPEAGVSDKINTKVMEYAPKFAKPWKFFMKAGDERADFLPGIPYVERTGMVINSWLASRAGSIALRRQIRNTALAEVGVATGLLSREDRFAKSHLFENKQMGHLPHIVEKMRNETYLLGRAIMDEHLKALMMAAILEKVKKEGEKAGAIEINTKRMQDILALVDRAQRGAGGDQIKMRLLLAKSLKDYFDKNADIKIFDAAGNEVDRKIFLEQVDKHVERAHDILKADKLAVNGGLLPDFNNPDVKKMNPDDIYKRYTSMVALTQEYKKQALEGVKDGRVPMVYLDHDLAELLGRAVSVRYLQGKLELQDDAHRMLHIRLGMEEELLRRNFFDYVIGAKEIRNSRGELVRPFENGAYNNKWLDGDKDKRIGVDGVLKAINFGAIRGPLDYAKRGEFAARNYLTGYNASNIGYTWEAERNKIEMLRQTLNNAIGGGNETFLRNYWTQVDRNLLTYNTLKAGAKFYTGKDWNADTYEEWKKRGVTYGDVQKGVWLIGGERVLTPLPSGVIRNEDGQLVRVLFNIDRRNKDAERVAYDMRTRTDALLERDRDGRALYQYGSYSLLMSDYADRPINLSLLFRTKDGKSFKPGSPMDRETRILSSQLSSAWSEMTSPAYGMENMFQRTRTDEDRKRMLEMLKSPGMSAVEAEARLSGRGLNRAELMANIRLTESMLYDHVRMTTRASLKDDPTMSANIRFGNRATQFLERVMRGGAHETDERLHQWYASQAYTRIVLQTFGKDWNNGIFHSDEVTDSLEAKKALGRLRGEQLELMSKASLDTEQRQRLVQLRAQIGAQIADVARLEQKSRDYQKSNSYVDRQLKKVADSWIPFYNIAEQTNMRDPRIAAGGGYAMGPAMMVGYQTGQFVGERPQMWSAYNINPGDRMLSVLARPSQWAAIAFGAQTRTFFTKMTGYTTVYHMDPERGISGVNTHEQGVVEAFQSLFKPSQSFDWFTRFMPKPVVRGFKAKDYKDEFGWNLTDETNYTGKYFNWPISFRTGGSGFNRGQIGGKWVTAEDFSNPIDEGRYERMGMDVGSAKRQHKLGLTFREEYMLWNNRGSAEMQGEMKQNADALKNQLRTATDATERRMLNYQIREYDDTLKASRAAWKIPGVGAFLRQGYYGVENRAGYDISAIGSAHRPWEMYSPYHKNVGSAWIPGMLQMDKSGDMQIFPRLSRTISGAWSGSAGGFKDEKTKEVTTRGLYDGARKGWFGSGDERHNTSPLGGFEKLEYGWRAGQGGEPGRVERGAGLLNTFYDQRSDEYRAGGMSRDLFRDALHDVYRRETPLLPKMLDLEMQRQSWSFQNSQYVIPLAPLYLGVYHIFRHSSKWAREQAWNSEHPSERDYGELTPDEKRRNAEMKRRMAGAGDSSYSCPTHGIILRGGQACPLCRSDEALKAERENTFLKKAPAKKGEQFKNWARSWMSIAPGLPGYYNNYVDQAHCAQHGIGYARGTACPLCTEARARQATNEAERQKIRQTYRELNDNAKEIQKISRDHLRGGSDLERGKDIQRLMAERDRIAEKGGFRLEDTRVGFRPGRSYLQAEHADLQKYEREYTPEVRKKKE